VQIIGLSLLKSVKLRNLTRTSDLRDYFKLKNMNWKFFWNRLYLYPYLQSV